MDYKELALKKHEKWKGKLSIETKVPITNKEELAIAYTPGVAAPCLEIKKINPQHLPTKEKGTLLQL